MKIAIMLLSYLFSGLEILTMVMISPLTLMCSLGLILFTYKIARDVKGQRLSGTGTMLPASDWLRA